MQSIPCCCQHLSTFCKLCTHFKTVSKFPKLSEHNVFLILVTRIHQLRWWSHDLVLYQMIKLLSDTNKGGLTHQEGFNGFIPGRLDLRRSLRFNDLGLRWRVGISFEWGQASISHIDTAVFLMQTHQYFTPNLAATKSNVFPTS